MTDIPFLRFEVPWLPDAEYVDFLAHHQAFLSSVYFSLHTDETLDARAGIPALPLADIVESLKTLPGITKYALLNSRFHAPASCLDPGLIDAVLNTLRRLVQSGCLDGIVYVDHYLLQALSNRDPELCAALEAVPGVNCLLDSLPRITHHLEYLQRTAFQPPGKLILDRSLNRNRDVLEDISRWFRSHRPEVTLGLLANEGCLPHCPFKLSHDSAIALGRMFPEHEQTRTMNVSLGCAQSFLSDPSLLLRSPFIRPEDIDAYAPFVQDIKLGGRTRGPRVMQKVLRLYLERSYSGNLLELMDTQELLADRLWVSNRDLPAGFGSRTMNCGLACHKCSFCRDVAGTCVHDLGISIKPMWA